MFSFLPFSALQLSSRPGDSWSSLFSLKGDGLVPGDAKHCVSNKAEMQLNSAWAVLDRFAECDSPVFLGKFI